MVGPVAKREAVTHLRNVVQMSERRACILVAADRKMIRYRSRRPPDVELRARLRDLANQRRRFGYRRLFILLREQGEPSGVNRIYRLYREEGLTVRKRKARRRAVGTRTPILVEAKINARWSLDFVHDQFALGRRFRILNIVDDITRECLSATEQQDDILDGPIKTGDFVRDTEDEKVRERLVEAFNTPLYPMILIANEVMQEGMDLQKNCRRVVHHDLLW